MLRIICWKPGGGRMAPGSFFAPAGTMTAKSKFFAEVLLAMPTYQINPSPRLSG